MTSPSFSLTAVVNEFPAPSQTFIERKLLGLSEAGVDVTVGATHFTDAVDSSPFRPLPLVPWRDYRRALDPSNRSSLLASARSVLNGPGQAQDSRLTAKERVLFAPLLSNESDVVHFEFSGIAVTYRRALSQLRPAKIAISCRGAAEQIVPRRDPTRGPQLREVFEQADLIHCVSDDIRRTVEDLGAPSDRILVNRPAVPVAAFTELALLREPADGHSELRVLSIGRLHWKKGFDDSLKAISSLNAGQVDIEYRIAGEGVEREKLSFLIDEYGLGGRATLLGTCTQDQIREQLTWADVLLLPSLSEGISNAVLEAMSSGLPVISTNCGGMREVIDDGIDGYLVEVGDIEAMAERLSILGSDPDLRGRLGAAAMKRADLEFDVTRQVGLFLEAYRGILPS
ncbi:MAG: glycosyltransferase [Microthrixaceae bacterium]